jgi:TonB family protein
MERPPVEIPPPDVAIDVPVETQSTAIQDVTDKPVQHAPPPPPPPPKAVARTGGGPGKNFPNSQDFYPPASQRLGETGKTVVEVCVNAQGKLTQEPKVKEGSGSARLDEGAVKLAKAGSGKYRPATEDGKPIDSCFSYGIKWELH